MPLPRSRLLAALLGLALVLSACSLPFGQPSTPELPTPNNTQAIQTIQAQLTKIAVKTTPTRFGAPTATPTLSPTPEPSPTETGTPTASPTVTLTPEPTATTVAGDPRLELGRPSWQDTFDDSANWAAPYQDEFASFAIADGRLSAIVLTTGPRNSWVLAWPHIQDVYLEVTARTSACRGLDRYGLLARAPSANAAYLFGFTCDGQYAFFNWNGARLIKLVDWTPSAFILAGAEQTNRMGLLANGARLSLYANGSLLAEVRDSSYRKGGFGVFIGSENTPNFSVEFPEISYWVIP